MVSWITKTIGVKDATSDLREDEFGSIIVDLRDIIDGKNERVIDEETDARVLDMDKLVLAYNRVLSAAALGKNTNSRVIFQCQAGMSRSCAFVAAIFVRANDMEWEDAIDFVKRKVPQCQMNLDLIDNLKEMLERL